MYYMPRCYYFVDSDGTECVSNVLPIRVEDSFWEIDDMNIGNIVELPPSTISTLFNVKLTFDNDPICIEY